MGRVRVVYGFKLRQFFGPLRHSAAAIALVTVLAVMFLPTALFVGFFLPDTPLWNSARLGELFATAFAGFLAFDLLFALGGGTLTHPAEIEFFATSRLRPREYLLADVLFQFTVSHAFFVPALAVGGLGVAIRLGNGAAVAGGILTFLVYAATGLALGQTVGVLILTRVPRARALAVGLVALFMAPAANFFIPAIPPYRDIPLPTTAAAYAIDGLLRGTSVVFPAVVLAAWALGIGAAWYAVTGRDVFPYLRPTMRIAFGQMDLRSRAVQQEAIIRGLSRITSRFSVDLSRGSPTSVMTRLHLTRIARDGSVLVAALLSGILIFVAAANRAEDPALSDLEALTTGWIVLMIPMVLSFNWNATERGNLWTVAMVPKHLGTYFRGFYRALLGVTGLASVVAAIVVGGPSPLGGIAAILAGLSACGVSVSTVAAVRIPTDAFSLRSVIPFLVVPPVSLLTALPVIGIGILLPAGHPWAPAGWAVAAGYGIAVLAVYDRVSASFGRRFRL